MSRAVAPLRDWHPLSSAVFGGFFFFFLSKGGTCCRLLPCTHFFSDSSKKRIRCLLSARYGQAPCDGGQLWACWLRAHNWFSRERWSGVGGLHASGMARVEVQGQERTCVCSGTRDEHGQCGERWRGGRCQGRKVLVSPPGELSFILRVTRSHQMLDRGC